MDLYDNKYGRIKASAVRHNGFVYMGETHADCFIQRPKGELRNAEQGFVTDNGLYVDREKALCIAEYFNQIKYKHPPLDKLLSEDLM